RNHILAKIVTGVGVGQIFLEHLIKVLGIENIDAHAGERHGIVAGHGRRVRRLFHEVGDFAGLVHRHHAAGRGFGTRYFDAAHSASGTTVDMVLEHQRIVHLVVVVARQNDYILGLAGLDDVQVLINGVGRATVPVLFVYTLLRRHQVHHFVELGA